MTHSHDIDAAGRQPEALKEPLTLLDRVRDIAPTLVTSPRFRSWIARIPVFRALSRHQTQGLFDLCAGFVYSQILNAFVETGMLEALEAGPQTPEHLAAKTGLAPHAAERLLRAAAALGLAGRRSGGRYGLGLRGAALIGNPGVLAMIRHHRDLYADLADPVALLHGSAPQSRIARYWSYLSDDQADRLCSDAATEYSHLMALSQKMIAEIVTDSFPFRDYGRIADIGGGTGVFLEHVAARAPTSELSLFDLPPVAAQAEKRLAEAGLADRIVAVGGDFMSDPLPPGQDLVTLVRVVYDHIDATVTALLRACRAALNDRGALLIAEPVSGSGPGAKVADAYFGFYLMAMGSGDTRTPDEHTTLLRQAGFGQVTFLSTTVPDQVRLVLARP